MNDQYDTMTSISLEQYNREIDQIDRSDWTKSSPEELEKIEDALSLRRGVLAHEEYLVGPKVCQCGKKISFYDFVSTAVSGGGHSATFVVRSLLGNKYGFQPPRDVVCSDCGTVNPNSIYKTPSYSCRER